MPALKLYQACTFGLLASWLASCVSSPKDQVDHLSQDALELERQSSSQNITPEGAQILPDMPHVIIFSDSPIAVNETDSCQNGYFKWLEWESFPEASFRPLSPKESGQIGGHEAELTSQGDPVEGQRQTLRNRIFEEDLAVHGYAYPFHSLILQGRSRSFSSKLTLKFEEIALQDNFVLSVGQLSRYTDHALTEIILSSPGLDLNESLVMTQSAASYQSRDYDAEILSEALGPKMRIIQDGPMGLSSGYLFLRPKRGVAIRELTFEIRSSLSAGRGPSQLVFALAQLFCGERRCSQANRVIFYDPGEKLEQEPLFSEDPSLALGGETGVGSTKFVSLGPGGRIDLELDGILINRHSHDLTLHLREGDCLKKGDLTILSRSTPHDEWRSIDRYELSCGKVRVDLSHHATAREIRVENRRKRGSGKVVNIDALSCHRN